jgi:hypothetical protein
LSPDKADVIRLLEAELDLIEGGGYGQPAGQPQQEKPMFYHSLVCINHWLVPGHESECHENCVLMDWVPKDRASESLPCHFIPLNAAGETAHSLRGEQEKLEAAVKQWLRTTIERLKTSPGPVDTQY